MGQPEPPHSGGWAPPSSDGPRWILEVQSGVTHDRQGGLPEGGGYPPREWWSLAERGAPRDSPVPSHAVGDPRALDYTGHGSEGREGLAPDTP